MAVFCIESQPLFNSKRETMSETEDVVFDLRGGVGFIALNRPKALNALTLPMIRAIGPQLAAWQEDARVHAVVVRGIGERAFCAGRSEEHTSELQPLMRTLSAFFCLTTTLKTAKT